MQAVKSEEGINGVVHVPIGYRFCPTDEELIVHYLRKKVCSLPLPADVIPEIEVFQSNPWDLPGDLKYKRHFFTNRSRPVVNKCCSVRGYTASGYWKSTGKDKRIVTRGSNSLIGTKKSFVFYSGKSKTQWVLREFCLVGAVNVPYLNQRVLMEVGNLVVCCVYNKKEKTRTPTIRKKSLRITQDTPSSSPCSSGVTEISSDDLDQEVESRDF